MYQLKVELNFVFPIPMFNIWFGIEAEEEAAPDPDRPHAIVSTQSGQLEQSNNFDEPRQVGFVGTQREKRKRD